MSEVTTPRRAPGGGRAAGLALLAAAVVAPFYLDAFWVQVGVFAFAAMVAALGLNLLVGEAGQLSLAHSFFVAVGAYGYTLFASPPGEPGGQIGWDLPPLAAVALAVAAAGLAGLLFSPIAARVRGIYLGVEAKLSRMTAWVLAAERAARPFSVTFPGTHLAASQGRDHRRAALTALALYQP